MCFKIKVLKMLKAHKNMAISQKEGFEIQGFCLTDESSFLNIYNFYYGTMECID